MARSIYGDEVGATLVTPLYARAHAHLAGSGVKFEDVQAQDVWAKLERLARATGETPPRQLAVTEYTSVLGTVRRSLIIDRATWRFVIEHPYAQVVTLGIGLCNRRYRLAQLEADFVGVDREPIIDLRKLLIPDDKTELVVASALEDGWLDQIEPSRNTLVIAEGLLMYLSGEEVAWLLDQLGAHFGPGTRLLADVFHPMAAQLGHPINHTTGAWFRSWHAGADGLAHTARGWRAIDDVDLMRDCGFLPAQWNLAFQFFSGRSMYTVADLEFTGA